MLKKVTKKSFFHRLQVAASGNTPCGCAPCATKPTGKATDESRSVHRNARDCGGWRWKCCLCGGFRAACGRFSTERPSHAQITETYKFPPKEGTARLENITHTKLAPDYHPSTRVRCWAVFRSHGVNSRPPNLPTKETPVFSEAGRNSVEQAFFRFFLMPQKETARPA